jgi:sulfide:quinone oxidoreductase
VDLVIALPRLRGARLPGLPHESGGFVPVDGYGRVRGVDDVWAVGDVTTRAIKQGGLAAQQADVAAADIAAQIGGGKVEVHRYQPALQGMLLTGAEPLHLQRDPPAGPPQKVVGTHLGPYLAALDGDFAVR